MSDETFHGKLSKLGFRLSREQLGKLVEEATKQRLTAVQVLEQVAEAERRARDAVNLVLPNRLDEWELDRLVDGHRRADLMGSSA